MKKNQTIHHHLAKSYIVYFIASMLGLMVDTLISIPFDVPHGKTLAIIFLGLGPLIILWAQLTSWKFIRESSFGEYFQYGPYRFVRNPTHIGLLILVTGYTLVSGSLVFFGMTLVGFLVSNIFFTKYETLNEELFGDQYRAYRSRIPKI
jgi:protein-S-isoprenylcysteine O-methyltransferase Ste14